MIRVSDLEQSLAFYIDTLGLIEIRRKEVPQGKFTLIFLATEQGAAEIELTYNWESSEGYTSGRNFGHLAFEVDNIYDYCAMLISHNITINRPPRCGYMAFIQSPDGISIELLQKGTPLPVQAPWETMENTGSW